MEAAIGAFERCCNDNPLLMLSALKFRGDVVKMPEHARERLEALRREVHERYCVLACGVIDHRPRHRRNVGVAGRGVISSSAPTLSHLLPA
jgi:hypothetical protein